VVRPKLIAFYPEQIVAQASQFDVKDVDTIVATVDLEEVRAFRCAPSRGLQAVHSPAYPRIESKFCLSGLGANTRRLSPVIQPHYYLPEQEIAFGPGAWLW